MATAHLLGRIYDALLDEAALTALPQRIAGALGARSGVVQIFLTEGPPVLLTHHGFSEAMTQDYLAHFHRVDVWNAIGCSQPSGTIVHSADHLADEAFERSEFWNDFIHAHGDDSFHCLGGRLDKRDGGYVLMGFHKPRRAAFRPRAAALLAQLAPHIKRVLEARTLLHHARDAARDAEATLGAVAAPLIRVDAELRIRQANPAAQRLLAAGAPLASGPGGVLRCDDRLQGRLGALVGRAILGQEGGALALARADGDRPLRCLVLPFRRPDGAPSAQAVLLLHDPARRNPALPAQLMEVYGLSPAEAQVAVALADGQSPADIARHRAASINTVRSQLASAMAKTAVSRQADLVALVLTMPSA